MTQTELGERLGLTRSSVANIEAGRQRVQLHVLVQAAVALSTELTDLVHNADALSDGGEARTVTPNDNLHEDDYRALEGQPDTTADFVSTVVRWAGSSDDE
ncbi:hypothetical protein GCM10010483_67130 [Actinokineospora diospyrosa]